MKKSSKLSNRILLFVTVTFVLVITLIVGVILFQVNSYNNASCEKLANNGANGLSEEIADVLNCATNNAAFASMDEPIVNAFEAGYIESIKSAVSNFQKNSNVDFFILVDKKGELVTNTGTEIGLSDFQSNASIASALKGNATSMYESEITSRLCATAAAPVKNRDGVIIGAAVVGYTLDKESIVDDLKTLFGTDFTIFSGDMRINTTVVNNGQRQIGTQLSAAVADIVIKQGQIYNGEAEILGNQYVCAYYPLKNNSGDVIGVLFAGQPLTEVKALVNKALAIAIGISLFAIIFTFIEMIVYLKKVISIPLKKVIDASQEIANGDLTVSINVKSNNEVGLLANAFTNMVAKLQLLIGKVNESAEQISTASHEIASTSTALSQGAVEQAASVEELSSSVDEIYTMTKNNSEMAENASKLSLTAKDKCVEGNESMQELLTSMNDINQSSGRISKIIKVIDDIAFQTNILSLNAAVEAAQAGQYGKGFAVVADNVKQLANRSANAASEIADMIAESTKISKNGSDMATVTAEKLAEVLEKINEMDSLIARIAVSSDEQTKGIAQINSGIGQISDVLQTNSAMSEESSASSVELSSQAELLKEQISAFKV